MGGGGWAAECAERSSLRVGSAFKGTWELGQGLVQVLRVFLDSMPFICIGPVCIPWTALVPIFMYLGRPVWDRCAPACVPRHAPAERASTHAPCQPRLQAAAEHAEAARRVGGAGQLDRAAVPRYPAAAPVGPRRLEGQGPQAACGRQGAGGGRRSGDGHGRASGAARLGGRRALRGGVGRGDGPLGGASGHRRLHRHLVRRPCDRR